MGDFSEAFDTMTEQLETRKNAIYEEHKYIMKQKDTMRDMAIHDQLTGLYNRRYVMEYIDSVVKDNKEFAVSLIDVDFLKYFCHHFFSLSSKKSYRMINSYSLGSKDTI